MPSEMSLQDFKQRLLVPAHQSWHGVLLCALEKMDENFLADLDTNGDWLPSIGKCFSAFSVPRELVQVVWLGLSPYPRPESAAGISFFDKAIGEIFADNDGGFQVNVNKAASLRNMLKAWLVATGRLNGGQTGKANVESMSRDGLINELSQLFERGKSCGWLWLNAGLSLRTDCDAEEAYHRAEWFPLIKCVLRDVSARGGEVVLLGNDNKVFCYVVDSPLVAPHPRSQGFIQHTKMQEFLLNWRCLIEINERT